jgi:hypothetical protein
VRPTSSRSRAALGAAFGGREERPLGVCATTCAAPGGLSCFGVDGGLRRACHTDRLEMPQGSSASSGGGAAGLQSPWWAPRRAPSADRHPGLVQVCSVGFGFLHRGIVEIEGFCVYGWIVLN